jgi:hypothetical protein
LGIKGFWIKRVGWAPRLENIQNYQWLALIFRLNTRSQHAAELTEAKWGI